MAARASGIGQSGARAVRLARAEARAPSSLQGSGWPWWTALVALVAGFGLVALAPAVVTAVAHVFGVSSTTRESPAGLTVAIEIVRECCLGLVAVGFVWGYSRRGGPAAPRRSLQPTNWAGAAVGIAVLLTVFVTLGAILQRVSGGPLPSSGFTQVGATGSLPYALDILSVIALGPICEELLFRGYVFTALRRRCGVAGAALVTGLCFGAGHLPAYSPLQCVPLAVLGVGLCILYWRSGSLLPCMIAHGLNNAAGYAAGDHFTAGKRIALLAVTPLVILGAMRLLARFRTVTTLATIPSDRSPGGTQITPDQSGSAKGAANATPSAGVERQAELAS